MKKTALVTGGNRGIGEQVCRELACAGWGILLAARDPRKGEAVAEQLRQETGGRVTFVPLDVTSLDSIADLVQRLQQDAIRLDALGNNAGSTASAAGPRERGIPSRPISSGLSGSPRPSSRS